MGFSAWISEHYDERGPIVWLAFVLEAIAATVLLGLMIVTCLDVAGRYFFNDSLNGATELTEIGIALIVFAEMPIITWRGAHVIVDILDNFFGTTIVRVLGVFSTLIISASFYFLASRIWDIAARSIRRGEVTEFLEIEVGLIIQYIAVMSWLTAVCMVTYGLLKVWQRPAGT